jgi:hypothetical protein
MLFSLTSKGQDTLLSKIKHIEVVSDVQDTMALLNKDDINKINKVFYERDYLDSLRIVDSSLLKASEEIKERMDSIVVKQLNTIDNQNTIIEQYQDAISEKDETITGLEKKQKKDKGSKIAWQSVSGTLAIVLIIVLLI